MSFWHRVRRAIRGEGEPAGEGQPPGGDGAAAGSSQASSGAASTHAPASPQTPEQVLRQMADDPRQIDEAAAVTALERLEAEGRAGSALSHASAVLVHGVLLPRLRLAMAETLSARADDAEALLVLAPLLRDADFSVHAAQLSAEIHERGGRDGEARQLYEAILARDVGHARAATRLERLGQRGQASAGGATLVAEGAMARGRYRIEQELGRGGAGTVFLARDTRLNRLVALKVYHRRGRAEWERLLVEARTPAQIEHPLVCRVLDLEESLFGLALEYLPSGSVKSVLDRGGYDVPRALGLLATAAEGLLAVHAAGFVHRDIKPSNLLLRRDGRVVLTDFGIALPIGATSTSPTAEGTLQYMPPEQKASAPAHPAADVFALARAANELLAGAEGQVPAALASLLGASTREVPRQRPSMAELAAGLAAGG